MIAQGQNAGKREGPQRNGSDRQHQRPLREKTLAPHIALGERVALIPFDISAAGGKRKYPSVPFQSSFHRVGHAVYPVAAFQKGHIAKGTHDILREMQAAQRKAGPADGFSKWRY